MGEVSAKPLVILGDPRSWQGPGSQARAGSLSKPIIASEKSLCEMKPAPGNFFTEFIGQKGQKLKHVKSSSSCKSIRRQVILGKWLFGETLLY